MELKAVSVGFRFSRWSQTTPNERSGSTMALFRWLIVNEVSAADLHLRGDREMIPLCVYQPSFSQVGMGPKSMKT